MSTEKWEQYPLEWRESIISLFKLQDIDFEKTFIQKVSNAEEEGEKKSPWITRKEAAAYAGVSTDTIDNWLKAGKVKYNKLADGRPGAVRISRRSLELFLAGKVKADPDKRIRNNPRKGERYRVN